MCVLQLTLTVSVLLLSVSEGRLVSLKRYSSGITRIHNFYRHLERATDMHMLTWDTELAKRAAEWSDNCFWSHQRSGFGENLAYQWSSGELSVADVIVKAVKDWHDEKQAWQYSNNCGSACHYTQIVWASTKNVGCAYSVCSILRTTSQPIRNSHYFVCFYDPPGNIYGQYPFGYGQRCSKCSKRDVCRQGLCCSKVNAHHTDYLPYKSSDS